MKFLRKPPALFRKEKLDAEMADEMRLHVELQTELNCQSGMNPDEARYAALRQFGNVASIQEQAREGRGWVWLEQATQDFRHAVRALNHHRGFTFMAVATLALGLGINAALFSVFNAVVLRPLPLKNAEELVDLMGRNDIGWRISGFSYPDYLDLQAGQRSVPALAAWLETMVTMDRTEVQAPSFVESRFSGGLARLPLQVVSQNFFDVLGADLAFGRGFRPEENLNPGANPVIVLQYQFWLQQFHGDPDVLGKTIKLRDTAFTVIGVTAPEFVGKMPAPPIGWVPAMMFDALLGKGPHVLAERHNTRFQLVARLPAGTVREQARAELEVLTRQLAQKYPDDHPKTRIEFQNSGTFIAVPLNWRMLVESSPVWLSFASVLLIACANVANLMLARASTRQQEIGVRLALGASRSRILRHLLMESMLVALAGGLAGLLVTNWTLRAIRPAIIATVPPVSRSLRDWLFVNLTPDYRVFGFTLILAFVAAFAAGMFPALQASRVDVNAALKNGGSVFSRRSRLRHSLVVVQIAACFTLLTASGFLVQLVLRNASIETGLHTENVYGVDLSLLPADITTRSGAAQRQAAEASQTPAGRRAALALARTLPGIKAVARMYRAPFAGRMRLTPVAIDDQESTGTPRFAKFNFVSAEYFAVLGIAVVKGRTFAASEVERQLPVVVISEATARCFWPREDPLGKRLKISSVASEGGWVDPQQVRQQSAGVFSSYEVIGVVPDTRSGWIWEPDETMLYLPLPDDSPNARVTLLQFTSPRATALPLALGAASAQGMYLSLNVLGSLDEARNLQLLPYKGVAAVGAGLGLLALLMAVVGLYGVMAFVVSQRVREIGIRSALGATAENIVSLFVRQGMRLVVIGLALGSLGGVVVAIVLSNIVVGAQPFDPLVCGAVALLLAIATLVACWLPTRHAAKVDPVIALRAE